MTRSYQYINYDDVREGECAAYVALNARDFIQTAIKFDPAEINAFGYWGAPSATAVTPYEKLCFAAFSIQKKQDDSEVPRLRLNLPQGILDSMDLS